MLLHLANRIAAILLLLTASASAGLLDGTVWEISVIPSRQTSSRGVKQFDDVLTFARGKAASARLQEVGAVRYSAKGGNGFYNWETAPVLRETNTAEWTGVINGGNIDGNLKWVTRDGRVRYFTIKGRKR